MSIHLKRLERLEQRFALRTVQENLDHRRHQRAWIMWNAKLVMESTGMEVEWIGPKPSYRPNGKPPSPMAIAKATRLIETGGSPYAR